MHAAPHVPEHMKEAAANFTAKRRGCLSGIAQRALSRFPQDPGCSCVSRARAGLADRRASIGRSAVGPACAALVPHNGPALRIEKRVGAEGAAPHGSPLSCESLPMQGGPRHFEHGRGRVHHALGHLCYFFRLRFVPMRSRISPASIQRTVTTTSISGRFRTIQRNSFLGMHFSFASSSDARCSWLSGTSAYQSNGVIKLTTPLSSTA